MEQAFEELVAADEEMRARMGAATRDAKERVEAARAAAEMRERDRLQRANDRLAEEVRAIAAATDIELEQRRRRRVEWVEKRRATSEASLPLAAETWARIVRTGK